MSSRRRRDGRGPARRLGARDAVLLVALAGAVACSAGSDPPADASGCFLAFNSAFDGFRSWRSYTYDGTNDGDAGVHVSGPRTEYINIPPPPGSTDFPVGTIIAKEVGAANPANHHIFVMSKRGCDFNASGAKDWEWMEISENGPGAVIVWRGVGPPAGEQYGGDPNGCNSCHVACRDNDAVCSTHLRLSEPTD